MLDVYCRVISPENKHESSNIQTDQVIFRDICSTDTFIHVTTASEKEAMNLKAIREDYMTKFGVREGNDKCNIIISRIKTCYIVRRVSRGQAAIPDQSFVCFPCFSFMSYSIVLYWCPLRHTLL